MKFVNLTFHYEHTKLTKILMDIFISFKKKGVALVIEVAVATKEKLSIPIWSLEKK